MLKPHRPLRGIAHRLPWTSTAVILAVPLGCTQQGGEAIDAAAAPMLHGTVDTSGHVPAIVHFASADGPGCAGVLVAPSIVLTRDCIPGASRCQRYEYDQEGEGRYERVFVRVPPVDPASPPGQPKLLAEYDAPGARTIDVVGTQTPPGYYPRVAEDCCGGNLDGCTPGYCEPNAFSESLVTEGLMLVYLAEPVLDVEPMKVLLDADPSAVAAPALGRYPVDLASLTGTTFAYATASAIDTESASHQRTVGLFDVAHTSYPSADPNSAYTIATTQQACTQMGSPTLAWRCPECMLVGTANPSCLDETDRSGAALLNAPLLGGHALAGITTPLVAGLRFGGLAAAEDCANSIDADHVETISTWDASYVFSDLFETVSGPFTIAPRENGTWIRARLQDFDSDGVANQNDNCPVAANPMQENCNADAEDAKGFPLRGDACDPIPCAQHEPHPANLVITGSHDTTFVTIEHGRKIRDGFDVLPRGSAEYGNGSNLGDVQPGLTSPNVPTHYSFCQKSVAANINCDAASIDNAFLSPVEGAPDASRPYHDARVSGGTLAPPFSSETLTYPQSAVSRTWKYVADSALWEQSGWIHPVSGTSPVTGWGTNLDGRFWIHSATPVGTFAAASSTGHRTTTAGATSSEDVHLSNHYFWLEPDGEFSQGKVKGLLETPKLWCTRCPLIDIWDGHMLESAPIVHIQDQTYGLPSRDGRIVDISSHLGPELAAGLANEELVWASAVEAMPGQSSGADEVAYDDGVAVGGHGSELADIAVSVGGQLKSLHDMGADVPVLADGPPPQEHFVPVYSRVEDRLFIVGSESPQVWMRSVRGELPWTTVEPSTGDIGVVESATYSFFDRRLWILDKPDQGSFRLLRLQLTTGIAQVVGTWEDSGSWDWHRLVLDRDGRVLVVASSDERDQHAVARIDVTPFSALDSPRVSHYEIYDGRLAFAPAVHAAGYTFYLGGGESYEVELRPLLEGSPVELDELAEIF